MDDNVVLKKGYLLCLVRGLPDEPHQWPRRFYILFSPSFKSQARLDCYTSEEEFRIDPKTRTTVYVEELTHVECSSKHSKPHAFDVHTKNGKVRSFAAESAAEMASWLDHLQQCMLLAASTGGDDSTCNSLDEELEENLLYQSTDAPEKFAVVVTETEASQRCGLSGTCLLLVTSLNITLQDDEGVLRYIWLYRYIRRYGRSKTTFTIEAGRKCKSGEGLFQFGAENGEAVFTAVQSRASAMRLAEKNRHPSLGPAPSLPERNYQGEHLPPGSPAASSQPRSTSAGSKVQMLQHKLSVEGFETQAPGGPPGVSASKVGAKKSKPDLPKKPRPDPPGATGSSSPPKTGADFRAKLDHTLSGSKGGPPILRPRQQPPPPPDRQFATADGQPVGPIPKNTRSSPFLQSKAPPVPGPRPDLSEYDLAKKHYPPLPGEQDPHTYDDADDTIYSDTAVKLDLNYSRSNPTGDANSHEYCYYDVTGSSRFSDDLSLPPPPEEIYDEPHYSPPQDGAGSLKMSEIFAQLSTKVGPQDGEDLYYDHINVRGGRSHPAAVQQANLYGHLASIKHPKQSQPEESEYDEVRVGP